MNPGISLGIFDLSGVIMLVLAGTSCIYILRLKNRSVPSQMLLWFFLCVILSSIATIITNIGTVWDWAFAPLQDAMLILGGVFLVGFAYFYPEIDQPREACWVVAIFSIISLVAITYAVSFAIRYIAYLPGDLKENQAFYLILPVVIVFIVSVFFRRSVHFEREIDHASISKGASAGYFIKSLIKPNNRNVLALRNYGLALVVALVPILALVFKNLIPAVVQSFIFNFGTVIAITAFMLTHLNYAPEPVSISAKLVGLSLVSVLLILGIAGVWIIESSPAILESDIVLTFIILVLASSVFIISVFPLFFRTAIINPLEGLLRGVKVVNEGNLSVKVDVQYDDEIGYLTRSFNRMVSSLNDLTQEIQEESVRLEQQVEERTLELSKSNQQLSLEVEERKSTETLLDRQLRYQQTIALCSQSLLQVASDEATQKQILNQTLEDLRSATHASRVYIHQIFSNGESGQYIGVLAEVSAPGTFRHVDNPVNQRIPLTLFPEELISSLAAGNPFGGPTKDTLKTTPPLLENLLSQNPPLLSLQLCPILLMGELWGYVGFDDCQKARYWDDWEVSLLRTASEMIGNTLQRWRVEAKLRDTMDALEVRIKERTVDLNTLNANLVEQIRSREILHNDLENRLHIEQELAVISTRLQDITNPKTNLIASLEDLGHIMEADRAFLLEYEPDNPKQIRDVYDWYESDKSALTNNNILDNRDQLVALTEQLQTGKLVFIEDTGRMIDTATSDFLRTNHVNSLLLKPLIIESNLRGVLGCSNIKSPIQDNQTNLRAFELVAGIVSNLLQREYLIQTLEEQVTERTRQLTAFLDMTIISDQALELADILQPTLSTIFELSSCDACCIHLVDTDATRLELVTQQGMPLDYLGPLSEIKLDNPFKTWLQESTNNSHHHQENKVIFPEPFCFPGYNTFFATRLKAGGKLQGLLCCYREIDEPYSTFQRTILTALGELLGIIVENYRLRSEAEQLATIEERGRLAREIHDAISQSVYSLSLFARSAKDAHDAGNEQRLISNLNDMETTALQAMREMRLLLYQLRETGVEEDIQSALEVRFNQVERRLGIHATCEVSGDILLPRNIRYEVWRILVEALNNCIKHANATKVSVALSINRHRLYLTVQDDGIGFNTLLSSHGMGLMNMQSRSDSIGGSLSVVSSPGKGTRVILEVPLPENNFGGS